MQKLDVLTGNPEIKLTPDQKTKVAKILADLKSQEKMDDDAAKKALTALEDVLTEDQKLKHGAVGLPRRRGGFRGFGGSGGRGGRGGGSNDDNPFSQEAAGKALDSLIKKTEGKATSKKAEAKKAEPKKTEAKKKPEPKKTEAKKKAEPKKPEPKKVEKKKESKAKVKAPAKKDQP